MDTKIAEKCNYSELNASFNQYASRYDSESRKVVGLAWAATELSLHPSTPPERAGILFNLADSLTSDLDMVTPARWPSAASLNAALPLFRFRRGFIGLSLAQAEHYLKLGGHIEFLLAREADNIRASTLVNILPLMFHARETDIGPHPEFIPIYPVSEREGKEVTFQSYALNSQQEYAGLSFKANIRDEAKSFRPPVDHPIRFQNEPYGGYCLRLGSLLLREFLAGGPNRHGLSRGLLDRMTLWAREKVEHKLEVSESC